MSDREREPESTKPMDISQRHMVVIGCVFALFVVAVGLWAGHKSAQKTVTPYDQYARAEAMLLFTGR